MLLAKAAVDSGGNKNERERKGETEQKEMMGSMEKW
jgi:hypothetical protein